MIKRNKKEFRIVLGTMLLSLAAVVVFFTVGSFAQTVGVPAVVEPAKLFDLTISLGNVLSIISMVGAMILVWTRLDKKQALDDLRRQEEIRSVRELMANGFNTVNQWIDFHEKAVKDKTDSLDRLAGLATQLGEAILSMHYRLVRVEDKVGLQSPAEPPAHRIERIVGPAVGKGQDKS